MSKLLNTFLDNVTSSDDYYAELSSKLSGVYNCDESEIMNLLICSMDSIEESIKLYPESNAFITAKNAQSYLEEVAIETINDTHGKR